VELLDAIADWVVALPAWAAWVALVLATFVSEDLTCVAAGLLAASGRMPAAEAIGAAAVGIFLGDLWLYGMGRWIGRPALRRAPLRWIVHDEDVAVSAEWFAHRGLPVILIGRFVPGSRLPTYFTAGLLGIGFWRFAACACVAVAIWAPLLGGGAMLLGRGVLRWIEAYELWALPALAAAAFLYFVAVKFALPAFTWRGRRMIVSRWRRMTRWEFWPPWLFYAPVVAHFAWLALRHKSLSLFTAVNPGVRHGGFVGESKSEIMERLARASVAVAHTRRIESALAPGERLERVRGFLAEHGLEFPIVLKPDAGQRGSGVAVVKSLAEAERYLRSIRVDCVVQEHVAGEEFGVFYYRYPHEEKGRVFSITRKLFPRVRGDGARTLERLILEDARAVCLAKLYLERNAHRLWDVPPPGAEVELVEIGNHCRGAVFLDGCDLVTPELEDAFDRISRGFEGFFFGRYDVRATSCEEFKRGRGFKVIELNGATSEATHIYDPRHGLLHAYGVLFEQWRILFRIAAHNAARGAPTVPVSELLSELARYRAAARSHPS
jgi:membrane protein DedA with SNARE-associated domain